MYIASISVCACAHVCVNVEMCLSSHIPASPNAHTSFLARDQCLFASRAGASPSIILSDYSPQIGAFRAPSAVSGLLFASLYLDDIMFVSFTEYGVCALYDALSVCLTIYRSLQCSIFIYSYICARECMYGMLSYWKE